MKKLDLLGNIYLSIKIINIKLNIERNEIFKLKFWKKYKL